MKKRKKLSTKVTEYRSVVKYIIQSSYMAEHLSRHHELTESEVFETLQIITDTVRSNLSDNSIKIWRRDCTGSYRFNYIKQEADLAIVNYFSDDSGKCPGFVVNKMRRLAMDMIFDMLREAGPVRSMSLLDRLVTANKRDATTLSNHDTDTALISISILNKYGNQRPRKSKQVYPLSHGYRMAAIKAHALQARLS